jgi:hypothetical protein
VRAASVSATASSISRSLAASLTRTAFIAVASFTLSILAWRPSPSIGIASGGRADAKLAPSARQLALGQAAHGVQLGQCDPVAGAILHGDLADVRERGAERQLPAAVRRDCRAHGLDQNCMLVTSSRLPPGLSGFRYVSSAGAGAPMAARSATLSALLTAPSHFDL